nr:hypothetical protein [Tanacetum cinerariifolium]
LLEDSHTYADYNVQKDDVIHAVLNLGPWRWGKAVIRTSWTNRNPGRHFYSCSTLTQRKAQQENKLSNLTRHRQLLARVNYRRAIIKELEHLPGNFMAYKTREHLKRIQKAVLDDVIELKKELRL